MAEKPSTSTRADAGGTAGADAVDAPTQVAPIPAVIPETEVSSGIGVEYGSPYDPNTPPWSVYTDPGAAASEREHYEEVARQRSIDEAEGREHTVYTFGGHRDEYEGTERLQTAYGTVTRGQAIALPEDQVKHLRSLGFKFTKQSGGGE